MNERQGQIVSILSNNRNGKIITSQELAKRLNVTNRTIKSDMAVVAQAFESNGARITGIRNKGYSVTITDENKFFNYIIKYNLKGSDDVSKINDNTEFGIYTARRLIGSDCGVRVEDISEEINYNRSYVSELMKWSTSFFASFYLKVKSASNTGKIVIGKENNIRMAMVELVVTHYHKVNYLKDSDDDFSRWFACNERERSDIRHIFLKHLRESGYSISDSNSQRMSMYLLLAYNRFINGKLVSAEEKWMDEIEGLNIHQLTKKIFHSLPERYQSIMNSREELCFFTMILLSYLDVRIEPYEKEITDIINPQLENCSAAIEKKLSGYGIVLSPFEKQTLENMLVSVIFSTKYGLDGADKFNYKNEGLFLHSPINLYAAYLISNILTEKIGYHSNRTNLSMFGLYFQHLLYNRKYPIKKLRLLSTATFGSALGKSFDDEIQNKYSDFIESVTGIELYEYRRLNPYDYDGFLVDLFFVNDGYSGADANGYNYSLPVVPTLNRMGEELGGEIFDNLLINAYQFQQFIPKREDIRIIEDYKFGSIELLFQSLALMHAKNYESARMMWEGLSRNDNRKSIIFNDTVVVCVDSNLCRDKTLELYCLSSSGMRKDHKFNHIIFCSLELDNVYKIKILETMMRVITESNDYSLFKQDPISCFEHIIRANLRNNKK